MLNECTEKRGYMLPQREREIDNDVDTICDALIAIDDDLANIDTSFSRSREDFQRTLGEINDLIDTLEYTSEFEQYPNGGFALHNAPKLSGQGLISPYLMAAMMRWKDAYYSDVIRIYEILLGKTIQYIQQNKTFTPSVAVYPIAATDKTLTWSSSNPSYVSVDPKTGVITGKGQGTATITATANDGSGKTASYKVTGVTHGSKTFTSAGTYTFVVPNGIDTLTIDAVAGGGGGGSGSYGGGGSSGCGVSRKTLPVTYGQEIKITVGNGGAVGSNGGKTTVGETISLDGGRAGVSNGSAGASSGTGSKAGTSGSYTTSSGWASTGGLLSSATYFNDNARSWFGANASSAYAHYSYTHFSSFRYAHYGDSAFNGGVIWSEATHRSSGVVFGLSISTYAFSYSTASRYANSYSYDTAVGWNIGYVGNFRPDIAFSPNSYISNHFYSYIISEVMWQLVRKGSMNVYASKSGCSMYSCLIGLTIRTSSGTCNPTDVGSYNSYLSFNSSSYRPARLRLDNLSNVAGKQTNVVSSYTKGTGGTSIISTYGKGGNGGASGNTGYVKIEW